MDIEEWGSWTRKALQRDLEPAGDYTASYNVAPQDEVMTWAPQIGDGLIYMTWGYLPHYANNPGDSVINARGDQVLRNDAWNESFRERRCLVPADGYYEWSEDDNTPYRIHREHGEPFLMAGLWREWQPSHEQLTLGGNTAADSMHTNAIITTDANNLVEPIHDRMPVIIEPQNADTYLNGSPEEARELLTPYGGDDLEIYEVSKKVNDPANDTPDVVLPADS